MFIKQNAAAFLAVLQRNSAAVGSYDKLRSSKEGNALLAASLIYRPRSSSEVESTQLGGGAELTIMEHFVLSISCSPRFLFAL